MTRDTGSVGVAVVAAGICGWGAACGGSSPAPASPGETSAAEEESAPAVSPYAMLPADAEIVMGFDARRLRESDLWAEYGEPLLAQLDATGELSQLREACGFDPLSSISRVILGGTSDDAGDRMLGVVEGISREQVASCIEGWAEATGAESSMRAEGELVRYVIGPEVTWGAWVADRTVVFTDVRDTAWLEARVSGEGGLSAEAPLMRLVERGAEDDEFFWTGIMRLKDTPIGASFASGAGPDLVSVYIDAAATEVLGIGTVVELASQQGAARYQAEAKRLLAFLDQPGSVLGEVTREVEMAADGTRVSASVEIDPGKLGRVAAELKRMLGIAMDAAAAGPATPAGRKATGSGEVQGGVVGGVEGGVLGGTGAPPPSSAEADRKLEARAVVFLETIGKAGAGNVDCDTVAAKWQSLLEGNAAFLEELEGLEARWDERARAAFQERYADRLEAVTSDLSRVFSRCDGHPDIAAIAQELGPF